MTRVWDVSRILTLRLRFADVERFTRVWQRLCISSGLTNMLPQTLNPWSATQLLKGLRPVVVLLRLSESACYKDSQQIRYLQVLRLQVLFALQRRAWKDQWSLGCTGCPATGQFPCRPWPPASKPAQRHLRLLVETGNAAGEPVDNARF